MAKSASIGVIKFKADLAAFARAKDINLATVCKKVVVDLQNGIVNDTPVDTGRARSSWAFGIDQPSDYAPPPLTAQQEAAREEAAEKGQPSPVFFEPPAAPDVSQVDGTQKLFITSNLEYIEPLENGHSKQAPAGMVRVNIVTVEASIESALAALNTAASQSPTP